MQCSIPKYGYTKVHACSFKDISVHTDPVISLYLHVHAYSDQSVDLHVDTQWVYSYIDKLLEHARIIKHVLYMHY